LTQLILLIKINLALLIFSCKIIFRVILSAL